MNEQADLESKIESITKQTETNHSMRVAAFKKVVQPIDETRKFVIEEREKTDTKIAQSESKIKQLSITITQSEAQLTQTETEREGLVNSKIELHKKMDEYKAQYPDELQLFYEEERNKQELEQLRQEIKELKSKLKRTGSKRTGIKEEAMKLDDNVGIYQDDYDDILKDLTAATKAGEGEIIKIEAYLNKEAIKLDSPSLATTTDIVCQDKFSYSIKNKVLVNQLKLVNRISEDLVIEYNERIEEIQNEIKEIKKSINMFKDKVKSIDPSLNFEKTSEEIQRDNQVITRFKGKCGKLQESLEKLRLTKLEFKARQDIIENWKLRQAAYIAQHEQDKIDNEELCLSDLDNSVLEAFLKQTLYKIEDFSSKKKLEEMLSLYVDKVARRENAIQKCYNDSLSIKAALEDTRGRIRNIEEKLTMDNEHHQVKNELKDAQSREKAIEQLMEERRSQLEFEILKQADNNFDLYVKSNAHVFKNVKKTYGSKISEKMKLEQKQEFVDMIREQYEKRYNEIKSAHYEILDVDKKLDTCDDLINSTLPNRIASAQHDREELKEKLLSLREQSQAFTEAENECVDVIEELLEQKKEEIYHQNNQIYIGRED